MNQKFKKIIHLQDLVDKLPDTFTDPKDVTKSHITAAMLHPIKLMSKKDIPEGPNNIANESKATHEA